MTFGASGDERAVGQQIEELEVKHKIIIKMKQIIVVVAIVGMMLTGCRESDDARRINEYFVQKGIKEKVKYKSRTESADGIFDMLFQKDYFRNNPKAAADFITELGYYEVVLKLEGKLLLDAIEDDSTRAQIKNKYSEKYEMINYSFSSTQYNSDYATRVALLSLMNIFLLPEKPLIAQDALELFRTIIEHMNPNTRQDYYINDIGFWDAEKEHNQAGLPRGFAVFVLDDSPLLLLQLSVLQKYYPNLYENPNITFPYLMDLKTAPEGFKEIIRNAPYLKNGGFKRLFSVDEKLFEKFKATSPKKGGYIFEYDDPFNNINDSERLFDYATDLLYPVSNPNNASIIIREKYIYQDITNYYTTKPGSNIYLLHYNIQVKDAVSGKILFNRTYKSTTEFLIHYTIIDNAFGFNNNRDKFIDVKKEIESIVAKM